MPVHRTTYGAWVDACIYLFCMYSIIFSRPHRLAPAACTINSNQTIKGRLQATTTQGKHRCQNPPPSSAPSIYIYITTTSSSSIIIIFFLPCIQSRPLAPRATFARNGNNLASNICHHGDRRCHVMHFLPPISRPRRCLPPPSSPSDAFSIPIITAIVISHHHRHRPTQPLSKQAPEKKKKKAITAAINLPFVCRTPPPASRRPRLSPPTNAVAAMR